MLRVPSTASRLLSHDVVLTSIAVTAFTRPITFVRTLPVPLIRTCRSARSFSYKQAWGRESQEGTAAVSDGLSTALPTRRRELPATCPGCGAPSQVTESTSLPGGYQLNRRAVKAFLNCDNPAPNNIRKKEEDAVFKAAVVNASPQLLTQLGLDKSSLDQPTEANAEPPVPVCNRCHNLVHHDASVRPVHPSIESIQEIIQRSPYEENHILHVIDAADFPLSLLPALTRLLSIPELRSRNRRSKSKTYSRSKISDISFVITKSDLLAPEKKQVDSMMPILRETLRDALARSSGSTPRLGNVYCVSAKRGWWTRDLKEDIWSRGGATWMVGKFNVGKSTLFRAVFPKGRNENVNIDQLRLEAQRKAIIDPVGTAHVGDGNSRHKGAGSDASSPSPPLPLESNDANLPQRENLNHAKVDSSLAPASAALQEVEPVTVQPNVRIDHMAMNETGGGEPATDRQPLTKPDVIGEASDEEASNEKIMDMETFINERLNKATPNSGFVETDLQLPAPQELTQYPMMPVISDFPGTTAAPIRIPFGDYKGELIDLPGLQRSDLAEYVEPHCRSGLVLRKRIIPDRIVIKPRQSLLLGGGVVRITPVSPDQIFMAHCFVPSALAPHLTATGKALAWQASTGAPATIVMTLPKSTWRTIESAGTYKLGWDVTRRQAGPLTRKDAAGLKPAELPFVIYATDILIEGCGWIEMVAQVRKKRSREDQSSGLQPSSDSTMPDPPEIEIFSPAGKFVGQRQPLNCYSYWAPSRASGKPRPRRSIAELKARIRGQKMAERRMLTS